ncbi:MAG: ScpA family protein [Candidatus Uhrbacteria bacterium]
MSFELKMEEFAGPLQVLLDLIEQEEMDITEVSLAKVADDYLNYVNQGDVQAGELADFLIIASRLLYIKSQAILPDLIIEEEEGDDLAEQLRMYKKFVEASKIIEQMYATGQVMYKRERPMKQVKDFAPPEKMKVDLLETAMRGLLKKLEPFLALQKASLRQVASVQERIKNIHTAIMDRAMFSFSEITGSGSRVDVITNFLALLELVKQQIVNVSQNNLFDEINIKRVD